MKKSWNLIKSILFRGKNSKSQNKFVLSNGAIVTDKSIICEKFNHFLLGLVQPWPMLFHTRLKDLNHT